MIIKSIDLNQQEARAPPSLPEGEDVDYIILPLFAQIDNKKTIVFR